MQLSFAKQSVLITGGAQGLGFAIAAGFLRAGAMRVHLWDIDREKLSDASEALQGVNPLAEIRIEMIDISDCSAVKRAFIETGGVDVLINNAGAQIKKAAADLSEAEWSENLSINLDGAFFCAQAAAAFMLKRQRGSIVNIASCSVGFGLPARVPYTVSKAGLVQLTKVLAAEWATANIRVNAVAPGYMLTALLRDGLNAGYITASEIEAKIAMRRFGEVEEVANAVLFLSSDAASYITGQTLFVDGGYSISK